MDLSKIRIREHFGLLSNQTSTKQINFLISPPKNRLSPQLHDVIVLDHPVYGETCQIIAKISQIASHEEIAGSSLSGKLGGMSATAEILGYINLEKEDKPIQRLLTPPTPGSRIHVPYMDFVEDALSRDRAGKLFEQPLFLGISETSTLTTEGENKQVNIYLNNKDLTSMHTLVAGVEGTGKTSTIKIIIEEYTKNGTLPIVVVDPNGEYKNAAPNYQVTTVTAQTKTLPKITEKQIIILDGQTLSVEEKTVFFNSQIPALVKAKIEKKIPSLLLIIEDPENINPETLKEVVGAKLGITAVLVTSHPTGLQANILTKIGNQIVGKTVDPTDIAYLRGMLNCTEQELASLYRGEFFVNGLNRAAPTKVQVKTVQP